MGGAYVWTSHSHDWIVIVESTPEGQSIPENTVTDEYADKQERLAGFLYSLCNGDNWEAVKVRKDDYYTNYMADADDVLRSQRHLLTLDTREKMGLWP